MTALTERAAPTVNTADLEGVWAVVYARREAIEKLHGAALGDTLKAIAGLDWGQLLDTIRLQQALDPGVTGKQLARIIGQRVEDLITGELPTADRAAWTQAMTGALVDATAEGQAAGIGLIGDALGVSVNWDLAAEDAKAALEGSQTLSDEAGTWIARQVHGLGWQIGQQLAALWDDGADRDAMEQAIDGVLGGSNNAGLLLDTAIGRALAQGALATYAAAGLAYADYVTAGDARVCAACGNAEDGDPYALNDCPHPPLHPGCRCTVSPSPAQTPTSAGTAMLAAYTDDQAA